MLNYTLTKTELSKLLTLEKFLILDYGFTRDLINFLRKKENQFIFIDFLTEKIQNRDYIDMLIENIENKYNIIFEV